jgi:hypothetical protein
MVECVGRWTPAGRRPVARPVYHCADNTAFSLSVKEEFPFVFSRFVANIDAQIGSTGQ